MLIAFDCAANDFCHTIVVIDKLDPDISHWLQKIPGCRSYFSREAGWHIQIQIIKKIISVILLLRRISKHWESLNYADCIWLRCKWFLSYYCYKRFVGFRYLILAAEDSQLLIMLFKGSRITYTEWKSS